MARCLRLLLSLNHYTIMAVAKVLELIAEGSSIEEAVQNAAKAAANSVRNVRQVYVEDIKAKIGSDGSVSGYSVNTKVTFVVDGDDDM